jgi:hypothetical protein
LAGGNSGATYHITQRFLSVSFIGFANFNALAADDPGDYIFVYQGSGAYSGALTLLNNQQLVGHGVGLTIAPANV